MKTCRKCGCVAAESLFYRNRSIPGGRYIDCKACVIKANQQRKERDPLKSKALRNAEYKRALQREHKKAPGVLMCRGCLIQKPTADFYRQAQARSGFNGLCKVCWKKDCQSRRDRNGSKTKEYRKAEYAAALAKGSRKRMAPQKYGRDPTARPRALAKYGGKRRSRTRTLSTELDAFVFDEAVRLRIKRGQMTGIRWSLDHVIPLHHTMASGLHNAFNIQVVPLRWNELKRNQSMDAYWPVYSV